MDIQQFKQKYIDDVHDLLNKLDNDLVQLEKNKNDTESVERIFRVMHTLKGTSGMYGFDSISELTHQLENVFTQVKQNTLQISKELFDITLASVDHIRNLLYDEELKNPQNIKNHQSLNQQLIAILGGEKQTVVAVKKNFEEIKTRTWHILFMPNEEIITRSINILNTLADLLNLGRYQIQEPSARDENPHWSIFLITDKPLNDIEDALIFIDDYCKVQLVAEFDIFKQESMLEREQMLKEADSKMTDELESRHEELAHKEVNTAGIQDKTVSSRIHVDASKLDYLMFLVSELVTTKSELLLAIEQKNEDKLMEAAQKVDKLSKQFRDNALDIRLISMKEMVQRFKRLVRDLANALNKKIDFETIGDDVELDKNIMDVIAEPIMHLIRNCIDHGIELPEDRLKADKPENGIVKLFAYKAGNFVFIQISDDGRGINKQKILNKAIGMGIITENANLTDNEIFSLIFTPGFSTAESITQVSGRGVGMDIVKKKIQEIRGEIYIDSEEGLGTSFTLKLQQTISIIDTLLVSANNTKYAIPIEEILNCELVETSQLTSRTNKQLIFNKELIPYISLHEEFYENTRAHNSQRVIVVQKQETVFAIIADEIIGEYQAVVKPLGKTFEHIHFISGASLLGDGSIALLLDTMQLRKLIVSN